MEIAKCTLGKSHESQWEWAGISSYVNKTFPHQKCESDSIEEHHQEVTHGSLILVQTDHLFASPFRNKGGGNYVSQIRLIPKRGKQSGERSFSLWTCPVYYLFLVKFGLPVQ